MDLKIINSLIDDAKQIYPDLPIMQKVVVTQGVHESGFLRKSGGSKLAIRCNNLFGIKAKVDSKGNPTEPAESFLTWEHINGKNLQVNAWFRKYADHAECFAAHRRLMERPRYARVLSATTLKQAFEMLYKCGYATDPKYPEKLMAVYTAHISKLM